MKPRTRLPPLVLASLGLLAGGACERRAATTAENPRQEEISLLGATRQLRCGAPSSLERSERVEACRVLTEFEDAPAFNTWPAQGTTDVWVGREFRGGGGAEVEDSGAFLLVRITPGAPARALVDNYRLRAEDLLAYTARDLPFTRARVVAGAAAEGAATDEGTRLRALLAAFAAHAPGDPSTVAWLRAFESDPQGMRAMRGPAAIAHTTGPSLRLYPGLYGYARGSRDGARMLVAFPSGAAELWRLPAP